MFQHDNVREWLVYSNKKEHCSNEVEHTRLFLPQASPTIEEIAQERLEAFKLKVQKQERLERLWTTHGSSARAKCSVWAPIVTLGNIVQRNKVGTSTENLLSIKYSDKMAK